MLPRSTNAEQEFVHWERWTEAAARAQDDTLAAFAAAAREDPVVGRLLAAVFGNSPFLSQCLISDQGFARELLQSGPDEALSRTMAVTADRSSLGRENVEQAKRRLREAKHRAALTIGIADIAGTWSLQQITGALSDFAAEALGASCRFLLREMHDKGDLALPDPDIPENDSGLIVLGMGKLGARELNYSSDIDLMAVYETPGTLPGGRTYQAFYVRVLQDVITLLDARTAEGFVFRVDFRLRPFGDAFVDRFQNAGDDLVIAAMNLFKISVRPGEAVASESSQSPSDSV